MTKSYEGERFFGNKQYGRWDCPCGKTKLSVPTLEKLAHEFTWEDHDGTYLYPTCPSCGNRLVYSTLKYVKKGEQENGDSPEENTSTEKESSEENSDQQDGGTTAEESATTDSGNGD